MASVSGSRIYFKQKKRHHDDHVDVQPAKKKLTKGNGKVSAKPSTSKTSLTPPALKELDILKKFDLTLEYGPCIGITRMERWERAKKFGLNPPVEVKDIISQHKDDKSYTECLWNDYSILK